MADVSKSHSSSIDFEKGCFIKANRLIDYCKLKIPRVACIRDFDSKLFVLIFNSIFQISLKDFRKYPARLEDEAHNIQVIVDTLSVDILGISMSHIRGEDVASGSLLSIYNLLEVLEGCILYLPRSRQSNKPKKDSSKTGAECTGNSSGVWVCPGCEYKKSFDDFNLLKTKNLSYACPNCENQLTLYDSQLCSANIKKLRNINDSKSQRPASKFQEYSLDVSPTKMRNTNDSDAPLIPPILIENSQLRPELIRAGLRDSNETAVKEIYTTNTTGVFPSMSLPKPHKANIHNYNLSDLTELNSLSSGSLPPMNTVIFRGVSSEKSHAKNSQGEKTKKATEQLKGNSSRSLEDVCCVKQDQTVQTSESLLLNGINENSFGSFKSLQPTRCSEESTNLRSISYQENSVRNTSKTKQPDSFSRRNNCFRFPGLRRRSASCSPIKSNRELDSSDFNNTYGSQRNYVEKEDSYIKRLQSAREYIKENRWKSYKQIRAEEAEKRKQILLNILKNEVNYVEYLVQNKSNTPDSKIRKEAENEFTDEQIQSIFGETYLRDEEIANVRELLKVLLKKEDNNKIDVFELGNIYQNQWPRLFESLALEKRDMQERIRTQQRVLKMIYEDIMKRV